jgi:hypothetical protein
MNLVRGLCRDLLFPPAIWLALPIFLQLTPVKALDRSCKNDQLNDTASFIPKIKMIPSETFIYFAAARASGASAKALIEKEIPYAKREDYSLDGKNSLNVDFRYTNPYDLPKIYAKFVGSGLFTCVEFAYVEYGGEFMNLVIPKERASYTGVSGFKSIATKLSEVFIDKYFCNGGCSAEELATNSPVYKLFEIEGRGREMYLKQDQSWEKYKVSFLFYQNANGDINVTTQLTSGWRAPYREESRPPNGRYVPLEDSLLTETASKIAARIAHDYGGEFQNF